MKYRIITVAALASLAFAGAAHAEGGLTYIGPNIQAADPIPQFLPTTDDCMINNQTRMTYAPCTYTGPGATTTTTIPPETPVTVPKTAARVDAPAVATAKAKPVKPQRRSAGQPDRWTAEAVAARMTMFG